MNHNTRKATPWPTSNIPVLIQNKNEVSFVFLKSLTSCTWYRDENGRSKDTYIHLQIERHSPSRQCFNARSHPYSRNVLSAPLPLSPFTSKKGVHGVRWAMPKGGWMGSARMRWARRMDLRPLLEIMLKSIDSPLWHFTPTPRDWTADHVPLAHRWNCVPPMQFH